MTDKHDQMVDNFEADLEANFQKTNRQRMKAPKTSKVWCGGCDANKAGAAEKCTNCGNLVGGADRKHRPMKKETSAR